MTLSGTVEIDGFVFWRSTSNQRTTNKEDRVDRRLAVEQERQAPRRRRCSRARGPHRYHRDQDGSRSAWPFVESVVSAQLDHLTPTKPRTGMRCMRSTPTKRINHSEAYSLERRLHEPSGKLFSPPSPDGHGPASSCRARNISISSPMKRPGKRITAGFRMENLATSRLRLR